MDQSFQEISNNKELGNFLKKTREEKGIPLESIQKDTKIRLKYLQAVENGEFSTIPGGDVYVKGFLKSYAEAVGLSPIEILQQYKKISGIKTDEPVEVNPTVELEPPGDRGIHTKPNLKIIGVPVAILAAAVLLFYGIRFVQNMPAQHSNNGIDDEIHQPVQNNESEPEEILPEKPEQENKVMVEMMEDTPQNTVYDVHDKAIDVVIETVQGECWISVKKDGGVDYEGKLKAGDTKSWTADEELFIRVGNPPVVKLKVNGQDLGIIGGKTRNIIFKRRD